jgi:uncharacterized protein
MTHMIIKTGVYLACYSILLCSLLVHAEPSDTSEFRSTDTWINSRSVQIPVTIVVPVDSTSEPMPMVILLHGHGGTRHEAGGYKRVAEGLAARGIASIRMDFPGCGDSLEGFKNNNLTNMTADLNAARSYALQTLDINENRMGMLGFSMGGRLALSKGSNAADYRAIGLWAPDAEDGEANIREYLGGSEQYETMKATAKRQGFAAFTTFWGQDQQLGYRWFTDMEASTVTPTLEQYRGALMVLYGDLDTVVKPEISRSVLKKAINASPAVEYLIAGADHGLGLFNNDTLRSEQVIDDTIAFFAMHL